MSNWFNKKKDDAASGGSDSSFLNVSDFFGGSGDFQLGDDSGVYSADNILDAVDSKPAISFNKNIECISQNGSRRMVMMNASGGFYDRRSNEDLHSVSMDESGTSLSVSDIQEDPSGTSTYSGGDNPSETSVSGHNEGMQPSSLSSSQEMPSGGGGMGTRVAVESFTNPNHPADDAQDDVQNATRALNALRSKHAALRDPSIRSSMGGGQSCPAKQAAVAAAK